MRFAILGNSGSGKSTLAKRLAEQTQAPVLDLDTIYWEPGRVAVQRPSPAVLRDLQHFCTRRDAWIIEGCYADVLADALRFQPELLFMNPGEQACLRHCRERPWEPHKYSSKAEQDQHLEFLLGWVSDYYHRDGSMSLKGHRALFDTYPGPKREIVAESEG